MIHQFSHSLPYNERAQPDFTRRLNFNKIMSFEKNIVKMYFLLLPVKLPKLSFNVPNENNRNVLPPPTTKHLVRIPTARIMLQVGGQQDWSDIFSPTGKTLFGLVRVGENTLQARRTV